MVRSRTPAAVPQGVAGAAPLLFIALHGLAVLLGGNHAKAASFAFLILAPLLAGGACLARAWRTGEREGWLPLAMAMLLWAAGMAAAMAATLLFDAGAEGALGMLFFTLYGVPLLFAMASPEGEPWHVRAVDGVLALALGYLFFVAIFSSATLEGADDGGMATLRLLFDIQNIYLALFALVRFRASEMPTRRTFFGIVALYAFAYLATAAYINHLQWAVDYGSLSDIVIDLPFLALASLAAGGWAPPARRAPTSHRVAQAVRAGSPLMLPASLLTVAALLVRDHSALAVAGFVGATLGYGLRSVLAQMRGYAEAERLEELSQVDALTGLPNRRAFDAALAREAARARREGTGLALAMIDIDHFKRLNDGMGHAEGDAALRAVAQTLGRCARRGTDMVARYGGEEFAAILPGLDDDDAMARMETMRAAVEGMARPAPGGVVTVSIGWARGDGGDTQALLRGADAALYMAKEGGRNRVAG